MMIDAILKSDGLLHRRHKLLAGSPDVNDHQRRALNYQTLKQTVAPKKLLTILKILRHLMMEVVLAC